MLKPQICLSKTQAASLIFLVARAALKGGKGIQSQRLESSTEGDCMNRILPNIACGLVLTGIVFGQTASPLNPAPSTSPQTEQFRATPTAATDFRPSHEGASEAALDPASLLPDLPSLPKGKATLIG